MIVAIHQPQFLPYLGFFHKVAHSDHYVVLDDVEFLERGFIHRNTIKMQTGTQWLTVPVVQNRGQRIDEVRIDGQKWRRKHWAAIESNYRPTPHFAALAPGLKAIIADGAHERVVDLDVDLLRWAFLHLGIQVPITLSSALPTTGTKTERLVSVCRAVRADVYLSGPGGRSYMELPLFEQAGVAVQWQSYAPREYPQHFDKLGFLPNLAVIDALFNCGAEGARALIA